MLSFDMAEFLQSLEIMGYGMLGIFIVVAVIFAAMKLLTKFFPAKKDDK